MASTLTHTFSTPTGNKKFTLSMWVKRCDISSDGSIFSTYTDSNNRADIRFNSANRFSFFEKVSSQQYYVTTNRLFRDSSAFYHIVVQFDTTQSTAADRIKLWVNGVRETSFDSTSYPSQDYVLRLGSALAHTIGDNSNNADQFQGYISHMAYVDGSVVAPTSFGETDSTSGIWKFKAPTGLSWGTNGFHLKFENSGNLGLDSSGQTNNFTVNGNLKQALDTPSNVYCTLNPNDKYAAALTNGNTTVTNEDNNQTIVLSTLAVNSGKWYWEAKINDTASDTFNVGIRKTGLNNYAVGSVAYDANAWVYAVDGNIYHDSSSLLNTGTTATVGDIIGFILDLDAGTLKLQKNGSNIYSGNAVVSSLNTGDYYHVHQGAAQAQVDFNFGNGFFGTTAISSAGSNGNGSLFEYDVPSNHYAINTKNINTYG